MHSRGFPVWLQIAAIRSFYNWKIIEMEFRSSSMENQLYEYREEAGFPVRNFQTQCQ